ncbi:Autophagy-related protein 14 [Podosphaera aphanis]|nr:Autophagy-related protein 14 [Podosphaera aphanis]
MQCDICSRIGGPNLPFLCPTDARNSLYEPRIQHAVVLLEKDSLERQVNATLSQNNDKPDTVTSTTWVNLRTLRADRERTLERTQQIIRKADELREKVEKARQELARKKSMISRRSSDLASASEGIEAWRNRQIEDMEKSTRMTRIKWNQKHASTISARAFLCSEAARLYGLKKMKLNNSNDEFHIGGTVITDLRKLNSTTAAQVSTALSHIVHLLILSAHYLGLRLPAEITLPHRDYPLPTIFTLQSSYKYSSLPFPSSAHTSMSAHGSRNTEKNLPAHPRPLFLHKSLPLVAAEDPVEYSLFIEGISLLAYNIAWVCKTQGIPLSEESGFRDVYDIGRNLYNLLIGVRPVSSHENRPSTNFSTHHRGQWNNHQEIEDRVLPHSSLMGKYSHSSAHSFLGNAEGSNLIRSWKLPSPIKLADRLRSQLMSEISNAEWEILDADAWAADDDELVGDDLVVIEQKREVERGLGLGMQSFMSVKAAMDGAKAFNTETERKVGTSGWTKLKPR